MTNINIVKWTKRHQTVDRLLNSDFWRMTYCNCEAIFEKDYAHKKAIPANVHEYHFLHIDEHTERQRTIIEQDFLNYLIELHDDED